MRKTRPLMRARNVSRHVPKMVWYSDSKLVQMLGEWQLVYIKPDVGSGGSGVIRVEQLNDSEFNISWGRRRIRCRTARLSSAVKAAMLRGRRYVIQRGIRLAKVGGKPFDLRVVWQKPGDTWKLTWMSAKIASRRNATVTNVAKGAVDARIKPTLERMHPPVHVESMLDQIRDISSRIVHTLGARFPFRIIGLDMAIDQNGRVWFIEANTRPSFKGLRKVDPVQYRRYAQAQRKIRMIGKHRLGSKRKTVGTKRR